MKSRLILDLCGGSGAWSRPYRQAGYRVRIIDPRRGTDIRRYRPPLDVWGILAAPPCTEFSVSGSRYWKIKPQYKLRHALILVKHVERIIEEANPTWWALENPVGRLQDYIGRWKYTFQPWQYGDEYFKRTCIWGTADRPEPTVFVAPKRTPETEWVHHLPPSKDRARLRSITPLGFATAFFRANP